MSEISREQSASSRREALKSTTIIGGASAITMLVRMVRTKVLAVFLGPTGIGLESVFDSVLTLVRTLFDLGLSSSGVRQIAASSSTGQAARVGATVTTLRNACLLMGVVAALALFLGRDWASRAAFGDSAHASAFGWLSFAVLFNVVAGGLGAQIQGMRRIGDLARMNILGAVFGALVSIPVVVIWGQAGVPAYMIISAAIAMGMAWFFARRMHIEPVRLRASEVVTEARGLLTFGLAFMVMALISTGAAFLVRAIVAQQFGLEGAGQFQAASALSMVYVGFVLQAMGTDFYPRLTSVATDNTACNRLVNEQAEVSLVLALPGALATIALAPWVVHVFYTGSFADAAVILAWQMCGMLLRVMSWPLGFLSLAKGRSAVFVLTDLAAWSVFIAMAWSGMKVLGLVGAGVAFFGLYVFHVLIMHRVARRLSGFRWDPAYLRYAIVGLGAAMLALWFRLAWPEPWATLLPFLIAVLASCHSLGKLIGIVGFQRVETIARRMRLAWLLNRLPYSLRR